VHISKKQHVLEPIFAPALVAAMTFEFCRILECSEKHVPNWDVREIVGVMAKLMMDPM
jgi:hypothetical protein